MRVRPRPEPRMAAKDSFECAWNSPGMGRGDSCAADAASVKGTAPFLSGRGIGERIARRRPDLHASAVGGGGRGEQILEMAHLRPLPERGAVELTGLQDRRIEF